MSKNSETEKFIEQLKKVVEKVENGNYDSRLELGSDQNINSIIISFNSFIDNLKDTFKELNTATQRYQALYDGSPDLHRSVNSDNTIIDCNKAYAKFMGYTKDEVIGMSTYDHLDDRSIEQFKKIEEDFRKNHKIGTEYLWFKRKNGTSFPVLLSSTALFDKEGNMIGSNAVIEDVSEMEDAQRKIKQSEDQIKKQLSELQQISEIRTKSELKYRNLYDNTSDLCRVANADNVIVDCNKAYAQHLGYTKVEVIGKPTFAHTAPSSLAAHKEFIEEWRRTNRVTDKEIWLQRKDGTTFPAVMSSTALRDEDGSIVGSNTIIKDITEAYVARKRIEELEDIIRKYEEIDN